MIEFVPEVKMSVLVFFRFDEPTLRRRLHQKLLAVKEHEPLLTFKIRHSGNGIVHQFVRQEFISFPDAEENIRHRRFVKHEGHDPVPVQPEPIQEAVGGIHPGGLQGVLKEGGRHTAACFSVIDVRQEIPSQVDV